MTEDGHQTGRPGEPQTPDEPSAGSAPRSGQFSWADPDTPPTGAGTAPGAEPMGPEPTGAEPTGPETPRFRPLAFLGGLVLGVPFTWLLQVFLLFSDLGGQGDRWFWWVGFGVPVALAILFLVKSGRDGRAGFLAGLGAGAIVAAGVCASLLAPGIGG